MLRPVLESRRFLAGIVGVVLWAVPHLARGDACPFTDGASALGTPALVGTTCGQDDDTAGTCAPASDGEDVAITWRAPGDGLYTFTTAGSALDTVLYIEDAVCGGTELDCNDDDGGDSWSTLTDVPLTAGQTVVIAVDGTTGCGLFRLDITGSYCGDGILDATEECDDANLQAGDGCNATCLRETLCGDGMVDAGEECDDGSALNSDVLADACRTDCSFAHCGDGVVDPGAAELCDDGNTLADDGCDMSCLPELGTCPYRDLGTATGNFVWQGSVCPLGDFERGSCHPGLGDGEDVSLLWTAPSDGTYVFSTFGSAEDGVLSLREDGCDGTEVACADDTVGLQAELGGVVLSAGDRRLILVESSVNCGDMVLNIGGVFCGNGTLEAGEECDDGGLVPGDGCDELCVLESLCGNTMMDGGEACDDGNLRDLDGCSSTCMTEASYCGDGTTDPGEDCDDAGSNSDSTPDACRTDCSFAGCGDGVVDTGEECDDGNPFSNDGCGACMFEQGGCPAVDAGSAVGDAVFTGSTCDGGFLRAGSCGGLEGEDVPVQWTAPADGDYVFHTAGSSADTVLYVRDASCGGTELGCSDNARQTSSSVTLNLTLGQTLIVVLDTASGCGDVELNIRPVTCGDGVLDAGEACDDGAMMAGDGCSDMCALESCGDGNPDPSEECDAGAGNSDVTPDTCRTDCRNPYCGDGVEDTGEACDDGNIAELDGCDSTCAVELSYCPYVDLGSTESTLTGLPVLEAETCIFPDSLVLSCAPGATGEDITALWTAPRDGTFNFSTADSGPDTVVAVFDGGTCAGTELGCNDDLPATENATLAGVALTNGQQVAVAIDTKGACGAVQLYIDQTRCGDMVVDELVGEECDDGNIMDGDGCSSACLSELASCGDGMTDNGEECDDGLANSDVNPDACRTNCKLPRCGDTVTDSGEECDDGDTLSGDGCDSECRDELTACIDADLGTSFTFVSLAVDTCELEARFTGSCSSYTGPSEELIAQWTAPGRGQFLFELVGDTAAPVLSVVAGDCLGAELDCDSADTAPRATSLIPLASGEAVLIVADSRGACGEMGLRIGGAYCGDGLVQAGNAETCDDGNAVSGDGCNSDCVREVTACGNGMMDAGEACDDGTMNSDVVPDACRTACQLPRCGDGVVDTGEACDDGNLFTGDGCNSVCNVEALWCPLSDLGMMLGAGLATGDTCMSGDDAAGACAGGGGGDLGYTWTAPGTGVFTFDATGSGYDAALYVRSSCEGSEIACEDGGSGPAVLADVPLSSGESVAVVVDGDGVCGTFSLAISGRYCGDNTPDGDLGEACDDGNGVDTDACSNTCQLTQVCGDAIPQGGEECDNGPLNSDVLPDACRTDCTNPVCGDAVTDTGEGCDNGIFNDDAFPDACRTTCELAFCGDSVTDTGEECDDGNPDNDDMCQNDCTLPPDVCGNGTLGMDEECDDGVANSNSVPNACRTDCSLAHCGDGVTDSGEDCDAGASNSDTEPDACRTTCILPSCGDGATDSGEDCDDGNRANFDGCDRFCRLEVPASCGNGTIEPGELCDDAAGNSNTTPDACRLNCLPARCGDNFTDSDEECDDGFDNSNLIADRCRATCALPSCGDAVLDTGEQCDDGGLEPGDGCDAMCLFEAGVLCGNGVRDLNEECDDGNNLGGDGCSANCVVELEPDTDGDGIPDSRDNCPLIMNVDQADLDEDGVGDVCDTDADGDGLDADAESALGTDPLNADTDFDTRIDPLDNCPLEANAAQSDLDLDGLGDLCDPDRDRDGILNEQDNCPDRYNADQGDFDKDGVGDYCDDSIGSSGCAASPTKSPWMALLVLCLLLRARPRHSHDVRT